MFNDKAMNNHEIEGIIQRLHEITRLSTDDDRHHLQYVQRRGRILRCISADASWLSILTR